MDKSLKVKTTLVYCLYHSYQNNGQNYVGNYYKSILSTYIKGSFRFQTLGKTTPVDILK